MKKLNEFFFGQEEISLQDKILFYGVFILAGIIAFGIVLPAQIQL